MRWSVWGRGSEFVSNQVCHHLILVLGEGVTGARVWGVQKSKLLRMPWDTFKIFDIWWNFENWKIFVTVHNWTDGRAPMWVGKPLHSWVCTTKKKISNRSFSIKCLLFANSSMTCLTTRKSCVNARGIPTAAYQVLHLLSCTRWGTPHWGIPAPARSDQEGGVPSQSGYPPARSDGGGTWGGVPPQPGLTGGTRGGVPPAGPGCGTPPPSQCGQTDGWMDGQTRVKTLPFRLTTYAVGKYSIP